MQCVFIFYLDGVSSLILLMLQSITFLVGVNSSLLKHGSRMAKRDTVNKNK